MLRQEAIYRTPIAPEWIDYNGHVRDAYYGLMASLAVDALMDQIGIDAHYREQSGCIARAEEQLGKLAGCPARCEVHGSAGDHGQTEILVQPAHFEMQPMQVEEDLRPRQCESEKRQKEDGMRDARD